MTPSGWSRTAAVLLAALLAIGCAATGPTPVAPGTPLTGAGGASPLTSTPPEPGSSTGSEPSSASAEPDPTLVPPPTATLVAGASRHAGEPGSWAWAQGSNDAPWLPAASLERTGISRGPVRVEVAGGVDVEAWSARAAPADDTRGENPTPLGDGNGDPAFDVPPGEWVLSVNVQFADGLGGASYYWYLRAE